MSDDELDAMVIFDAIAYNAYPHTSRLVRARLSHPCVAAIDVSWARACRTIRPGEQYVRVTVFASRDRPPMSAAVCAACSDGCPDIPTVPLAGVA